MPPTRAPLLPQQGILTYLSPGELNLIRMLLRVSSTWLSLGPAWVRCSSSRRLLSLHVPYEEDLSGVNVEYVGDADPWRDIAKNLHFYEMKKFILAKESIPRELLTGEGVSFNEHLQPEEAYLGMSFDGKPFP